MRNRALPEMDFLSNYKDGRVLLKLHVQPKASKNRFAGIYNDAIKLAVTAPPVDGKANTAVIKFLASSLNLKKKDLEIRHGLQSRTKSILIAGRSLEELRSQILAISR